MEYKSYEAAIEALVQDNDGMLPNICETITITLSTKLSNLPVSLTVGELVARALLEISIDAVPTAPPASYNLVFLPVTVPSSDEPVVLSLLSERAIEAVN